MLRVFHKNWYYLVLYNKQANSLLNYQEVYLYVFKQFKIEYLMFRHLLFSNEWQFYIWKEKEHKISKIE